MYERCCSFSFLVFIESDAGVKYRETINQDPDVYGFEKPFEKDNFREITITSERIAAWRSRVLLPVSN